MKKLITFTLCMAMTLILAACGTYTDPQEESPIIGGDPATWGPTENETLTETTNACETCTDPQEENPIIGSDPATWGPTEYETLAEAIKACGFDFSVPDTVSGYKNKLFTVFNNGLIQVIYSNEDELNKLNEEELNNVDWETVNFNPSSLIIRKAVGNGDISGDYNRYTETNTISVNDLEITTKGNDGMVNVAIWMNNGYTFAIATNNSISGEQISELIKNIQ